MTIIKSFTKFFSKNVGCLGLSPKAFSAENESFCLRSVFLKVNFCTEMYSTAMTTRQIKEDPENHDSLVEDEEKVEEVGESEPVEAPEFSDPAPEISAESAAASE